MVMFAGQVFHGIKMAVSLMESTIKTTKVN